MSIFNYTLPSGNKFTVRGPANATQAQADKIFYEQVAAGSLVNYKAGQVLTSAETKITKFELSRLDRGTAGVDTAAVLSIMAGLPMVSGVPNLTNVPLTNPIDQADVVTVKGDTLGVDAVGPLTAVQVQKLLAQIVNIVDQAPATITQDKGIGQYGFTCYQLELAGYIKPGTFEKYLLNTPEDFVSVMAAPGIWTGKDGVNSLDDLLNNPSKQNAIQTELMEIGYNSLTAAGVITVAQPETNYASTGQIYTNSGLQSISAISTAGTTTGSLATIAKNANSGTTTLSGLLGSQVSNLSTISSGAVNALLLATTASNLNFGSLAAGLTTQVTGQLGALITNAGKFGAPITSLWASTGGLEGLGKIATTGLTSIEQTFTGIGTKLSSLSLPDINLNSITTSLTNLVPGSFSNLGSSLDIMGKAGQFGINFSNPLASLNNFGSLSSLGNLGSLSSLGNLGNLGSLSSLGNLSNLGSLSSLGNLGSLSSLGNLGSLTSLSSLGLGSLGGVGDLFGGGGDLVSGTQVAGGYNNTVSRQTVDAAFKRIVGSNKVPTPVFEYPSPQSAGTRLDIQQAESILSGISSTSEFGSTIIG